MIQSMMDEVFIIADRVFRDQTGAACPGYPVYILVHLHTSL